MASYRANLIDSIEKLDKEHKHEKNLRQIQGYLRKYPDDHGIRIFEARTYAKMNRKDKAKLIYQNIIETSTRDIDILNALKLLADTEFSSSNYEEALKLYKTYIDNAGNNLCIQVRISMSRVYSNLGMYEDALDILTIEGLDNMELKLATAHVYFVAHNYDKCLEIVDGIINEQVSNNVASEVYLLKAEVYLKLKRIPETIELYKKVIEQLEVGSFTYFDTKRMLAAVYSTIGDRQNSIKEYEEILNNTGNKKIINDVNYQLGRSYLYVHDTEKAYKYFSQCYDDQRNIGYARIAYHDGKFEEALKLLSNIQIKDNYTYRDVHIISAQIMFRLGKNEKFISEYEKITENAKNIGKTKAFNKETYSIEYMRSYLESRKGLVIPCSPVYISGYAYRQISSYNEEMAIEHIKSGHTDEGDEYSSLFEEGVDIKKLYYFVLEHLDQGDFKYGSTGDIYLIDLKKLDCPYSDKLIEVSCIFGSHDIITMYPVNYRQDYEQIQASKVRKKSIIDKFNKKYGM